MRNIHRDKPIRTCTKSYASYGSFKPYLRSDFHKRCGYCDGDDKYSGGFRNFQIDHFAPKSKFPALESSYTNLVYSCFYCNNAKSDDWPSNSSSVSVTGVIGYIDPCDVEYDNHLSRNDTGEIKASTELGNYIYKKLNLGLRRHALIWQMARLSSLIDELTELTKNSSSTDTKRLEDKKNKLLGHHYTYLKYFEETIEI